MPGMFEGMPPNPQALAAALRNQQPASDMVRKDGTQKGMGWLGPMKRPDGKVSTELSVGVNLGGKETELPLMVPGLNEMELTYLLSNDPQNPEFQSKMPPTIMQKALDHAQKRMSQGLSPFKE